MIQPTPAPAPQPIGPTPAMIAAARNRLFMRSGARWFYWIAGLSLINAFLFITGAKLTFVVGLGITDAANAFARSASADGSGLAVALAFDAVIAAGFIALGYMAEKAAQWAFIVGLIAYGLDAALLVWAQDWLSVGFHGLALYFIWRGFSACRSLAQLAPNAPTLPPGMAPPINPR